MTDEGTPPDSPSEPGSDTPERDERLAALLFVEIAASEQAARQPRLRATRPAVSDAGAGPDADAASDDPPPRPRLRNRILAFGLLAVLLVGGLGLVYAGSRIIRSSTKGKVLQPIDDPTAPGFEAIVDPTPTIVILHDAGGLLDSVTFLTLPDPEGGGGGVVMIPARTVRELPIYGLAPIEIAYDLGDAQIETQAVGGLLGTAPGETAVVDAARWADLVAPVAPIVIDNPDRLLVDGDVRFAQGEIELESGDVGAYLEATREGESELARLFRHGVFWRAWLDAVAENGTAEAVPGELDSGIGRFVRSLAGGERVVATLPVDDAEEGRFGDEPAFVPEERDIEALVSRLVPFPVSPAPGVRARLRLLNGTPDTSAASSIAAALPPAGVQVVLIGNASSLDVAFTTIEYAGAEFRDRAVAIADILGVGQAVEDTRPSDAADITVTLGADYG